MKNKRVAANYAVSREQKRLVAKNRAKKQGLRRICSKCRGGGVSWFQTHWRDLVGERNNEG